MPREYGDRTMALGEIEHGVMHIENRRVGGFRLYGLKTTAAVPDRD